MAKDVKAGGAYVDLGLRHKLDTELGKIEGKFRNFGARAAKIGAGVGAAGASILGPLIGAAKVFADVGAPLDDISKRTGVAKSTLSGFQFVAEQSGTSLETVEGGLKKMAKNLYAADEEGKGAVDMLGDLGLNVDELRKMNPEEQFLTIADAISKVEDPSKKTALAMQIFGGAGADLIPMLEGGSKGIGEMVAQGKKLGIVLSDDAVTSAAELDDTFGAFYSTLKGVVVQVGAAIAGPLTSFLKIVSGIIGNVSNWIAQNQWLVQIVGAVGVGLVVVGGIIAGVGVAATALASGISVIATVLGAILSPIGLVVIGIGGIVVALATMTDLFDPVINYLSEGFTWLSDIVGETVGGIRDALATGDIAGAALIAFTGLRLVVSQIMESVLGVFGTSIAEMSRLLAELWKGIGTVVARLNEARANVSQWIAVQGGKLFGVKVEEGDNEDLANARAWTQGFKDIDVDSLGKAIQSAFDPELLKADLDALVAGAHTEAEKARAETEAAKREGFKGLDPTLAASQAAKEASKASLGSHSVAELNRNIGSKDHAKDTAKNTKDSADALEELVRIVPLLGPRFG